MRGLRFCIVSGNFSFGGLEKYISDFAREACKKGHKVVLITSSNVKSGASLPFSSVYRVNMSVNRNYTELLSSIHEIRRVIEKEECDIIFLHPFVSIFDGYIAAVLTEKPFVVFIHGPLSLTYTLPPNAIYRTLLEHILPEAARIYCVSEDLKFLLRDIVPPTNITLFPNALPENYFKDLPFSEDGDVLLLTTLPRIKIEGIKKFVVLLKDAGILEERKLHVFGSGDGYKEFTEWLKNYGMADSVIFYGFKENYLSHIKGKVFFGAGMARSAIELMAKSIPVFIIGPDGPKGFVKKENFQEHMFSNFSGLYMPDISVLEFTEELNHLKKVPWEYNLKEFVREYLNYEKFFEKFERDIREIVEKFKGYNEESKKKALIFLLSYYSAKNLFDTNFVYNLVYFFKQKSNYRDLLIQDITEKYNYFKKIAEEYLKRNRELEKEIEQKGKEIKHLKMENEYLKNLKESAEKRVREILNEKNRYERELNKIYTSRFWKIASLYYRLRNKFKELPLKVLENYTINKLNNLIADNSSYTFIYPPTVDWNIPLFQRPQHISLELSKLGNLVLYFTPNYKDKLLIPKKFSDNLLISPYFKRFIQTVEGKGNVWLFIPSTNNEITIWDIRKLKNRGIKIIYDYIDEIHEDISPETHISLQTYRELRNEDVDIITCVSKKLYEEMRKRFPKEKVLYLPNGVEYEHFKVYRDLEKINDFMKSIVVQDKPLIGYYGALAKWIDFELLIKVAVKNKDMNFVLIGVDYDGSLNKYLPSFPENIYYVGYIPYKDLPWYAIWFDVAIIPFRKGDIAKATSPIKMYEYMALNKPVVATEDLLECYGYIGVLISINDVDDFTQKLRKALDLSKDSKIIQELDRIARENTWKKRAEKLVYYIKSLYS